MNLSITVAEQADGSLAYHPSGPGLASVSFTHDPGQPKTATIAFAGSNQALVNFDDSGRNAINFVILNPGAGYQVQQTVMNLIQHISQLH